MNNYSQPHKFQQSPSASPRLLRSRSANVSPLPDPQTLQSKQHGSRIEKNPKNSSKKTRKKWGDVADTASSDGGFIRFVPQSENKMEVKRRTRSASTSPSAWALSPGRSPARSDVGPPLLPKSPASFDKLIKREGESGGGVSGMLKYFKQKKVSSVLEEEHHRFRVAYNRLLQWRFANARGDASMAAVKRVAQKKLFNGWSRIALMRNFITEKREKIQRLKQEIKLYHTCASQMNLLNEWSRIEPKNVEAVGRVVRKLSAISHCLPLIHDAEVPKADVVSVKDAMLSAMEVMNNMQGMILNTHQQVERTCFLLTELYIMLKQQKQFFKELEKMMIMVASLEVQEKSLTLHRLQLANEVNENKARLEWQDHEFDEE